jgi:hypothetical protein
MRRLILILISIWFDLIKSGEKTEEYREITPYWVRRFIDECYVDRFLGIFTYDPKHQEIYEKQVYLLVLEYFRRGKDVFRHFDELEFTKGYPRKDDAERRMVKQQPKICIGYGLESMGAIPNKLYFVITWKIMED